MSEKLTRADVERIADERVARALRLVADEKKRTGNGGMSYHHYGNVEPCDVKAVATRLTEQPAPEEQPALGTWEDLCRRWEARCETIEAAVDDALLHVRGVSLEKFHSPREAIVALVGCDWLEPVPEGQSEPDIDTTAQPAPDPLPPLDLPVYQGALAGWKQNGLCFHDNMLAVANACRIARAERAAREQEARNAVVSHQAYRDQCAASRQAERERDEARSDLAMMTDLYERAAKRLNAIAKALD